MSKISEWSTTAANNNSASPDGFPEGMNPSGVNNSAREVMASVRDQWEGAEWFDWGDTPSHVTSTTFTITGDVTARYTDGRAIKLYGSGMGTIERHILSSSYSSPNTAVTIDAAAGLDATLSQVWLGVISSNGESFPDTLDNQVGFQIGSPTGDTKGAGTLNVEGDVYRGGYKQTIFSGAVDGSGNISYAPSGWTASRPATGQFTITHNLGLTSGSELTIVATTSVTTSPGYVCAGSSGLNSFDIYVRDTAGASQNAGFKFIAHLNT